MYFVSGSTEEFDLLVCMICSISHGQCIWLCRKMYQWIKALSKKLCRKMYQWIKAKTKSFKDFGLISLRKSFMASLKHSELWMKTMKENFHQLRNPDHLTSHYYCLSWKEMKCTAKCLDQLHTPWCKAICFFEKNNVSQCFCSKKCEILKVMFE